MYEIFTWWILGALSLPLVKLASRESTVPGAGLAFFLQVYFFLALPLHMNMYCGRMDMLSDREKHDGGERSVQISKGSYTVGQNV